MSQNLSSCPFCAGDMSSFAGISPDAFATSTDGTFAINCDCGVIGPSMPSQEEAIAAWNRRASAASVREALADAKANLRLAFRKALSDLPEIAPPEIAAVLSSVHMNDEFLNEGKRLQMEHGLAAVAPRMEQECGAGAWSFMRAGVAFALSQPHPADERDRLIAALEKSLDTSRGLQKQLDDLRSNLAVSPADERVVEALRIGQSYVLDAMRNDGGIENCEIGYRTDYEKIHSVLATLSAKEGR
jgi:hypothetical protein